MRSKGYIPPQRSPKLGKVVATITSFASCPEDCPLYNAGCYAQLGRTRWSTSRLEMSGTPEEIAVEEAAVIRSLPKRKPLRLHVAGDCKTEGAARLVAAACAEREGPAWTYTHAWRRVRREAWGEVVVWASVESPSQLPEVEAQGYERAALVVPEHETDKARRVNGRLHIPCVEQTRGVKCSDCGICWRAKPGTVVEFAAHGARKRMVREILARKGETNK